MRIEILSEAETIFSSALVFTSIEVNQRLTMSSYIFWYGSRSYHGGHDGQAVITGVQDRISKELTI